MDIFTSEKHRNGTKIVRIFRTEMEISISAISGFREFPNFGHETTFSVFLFRTFRGLVQDIIGDTAMSAKCKHQQIFFGMGYL